MPIENQDLLENNRKVQDGHTAKAGLKCPDSNQRDQSPNLLRGESLITFRWESMNALEIASVLDSTFPSKSDSSTLTEEGYPLYDDEDMWLPTELMLNRKADNCVADHIEDTKIVDSATSKDVFPTSICPAGEDCTPLLINNQDDGVFADCSWGNVSDLDEIGDNTSLSAFEGIAEDVPGMATLPSPALGCSVQDEKTQLFLNSNFCDVTTKSFPVIESTEVSSISQCSSADMRPELTVAQHSCKELDAKTQSQLLSPASDANDSLDGRTARARRVAANQRRAGGRAKKYLPYRLASMPSPVSSDRNDRVDCFPSERGAVHFPLAQKPLQPVRMAPGAPFQPTVQILPVANQNECTMMDESLEAGILEQLKCCAKQLDEQTRLCIRDSLYRLARSAKERQNEAENSSINRFMANPAPSRLRNGSVEAETNPFDRRMVNLLFCKVPNVSNFSSQPYAPFPTEGISQSMLPSAIMNQSSHQWNSCRILPDFRLCTY